MLKAHQRLWLDPWRAAADEPFRTARESDDWQKCVADDFALWLNGHLKRAGLPVGLTARQEWRTCFQTRLREMERALKGCRDA